MWGGEEAGRTRASGDAAQSQMGSPVGLRAELSLAHPTATTWCCVEPRRERGVAQQRRRRLGAARVGACRPPGGRLLAAGLGPHPQAAGGAAPSGVLCCKPRESWARHAKMPRLACAGRARHTVWVRASGGGREGGIKGGKRKPPRRCGGRTRRLRRSRTAAHLQATKRGFKPRHAGRACMHAWQQGVQAKRGRGGWGGGHGPAGAGGWLGGG